MAELIKDMYASQLLVTLAKQLGFEAEPSAINLANDVEDYSIFTLHMWLINNHKLYVHISSMPEGQNWSSDVYSTEYYPNDGFCAGLQNNPTELGYSDTYCEALETGLKYAFQLLIERKKNGELQKPA